MSKGDNKKPSSKRMESLTRKRAAQEAQRRKEKKKNLIVVLLAIVAIVSVSIYALTQGDDPANNDGNPPDDEPDDGTDIVEGLYGQIISGHPTIMDIGSTSCIPCQQLQPVLHSLGQKFDGEINIEFYDCWNTAIGAEMATHYQCSVIPTLIFLDGSGNEVARMLGYNSQADIEAKMAELGWI